jgi:hypothetical protein
MPQTGVIQVTLINQMIRDERRVAQALVHQIWNQAAWLDCERLFHFSAGPRAVPGHMERPCGLAATNQHNRADIA